MSKKTKKNNWKEEFKTFSKTYLGWGVYVLEKDDIKIYVNPTIREVVAEHPYKYLNSITKDEFKSLSYHLKKFSTTSLPVCQTCQEDPIIDYEEYCISCAEKEYQKLLDEIKNMT